jgi:hypothetical protein
MSLNGLHLGAGAVLTAAAVTLACLLPPSAGDWRVGVVAATTGLFAAATGDVLVLLGVTVIAGLLVDGFLVDQLGVLAWHGPADLIRLALLVGAGTAGLLVRAVHGHRRAVLPTSAFEEEKRGA